MTPVILLLSHSLCYWHKLDYVIIIESDLHFACVLGTTKPGRKNLRCGYGVKGNWL